MYIKIPPPPPPKKKKKKKKKTQHGCCHLLKNSEKFNACPSKTIYSPPTKPQHFVTANSPEFVAIPFRNVKIF